MRSFVAILFLLVQLTDGADYYISLSGNDANDGSVGSKWRTLAKATNAIATVLPGDTVHVDGTGDAFYDEAVEFLKGGTAGNLLTYISEGGTAVFRQARIRDPYIRIEGFRIAGANQMSWQSHVRFENDADFCQLVNIDIGPGAYVVAPDWSINGAANTITSPSVDFVAAGFEVGMTFYLGASGLPGLFPDNHDTVHTISNVATTTLTTSTDLIVETVDPFWAPVFVGPDRNGIGGIIFIVSSSLWANNCLIDNVRIEDIWGEGIVLNGTDHEVRNCIVTTDIGRHTYPGLKPFGSNQYVHHNLFKDATNVLFYTTAEGQLLTHPPGAGWYDYQAGFIHSSTGGTGGGLNNRVEFNWFENVHNPLGQISESSTASGFDLRNNVFVGVASAGSGGRNGLEWTNNTFYRVGYRYPDVSAFVGGGNTPSKPQTGLVITECVFVDCGSHWKDDEGFYAITPNTTTPVINENFVAGPETSGFAARGGFSEAAGINGGDPVFINPSDPLGPDGAPFTDDDGLRPLPSSPFAALGWGALTPVPVVVGQPFAHFCIAGTSQGLGWKDEASYDFDAAWLALEPYERTAPVRPYTTPEALGFAPVDVEFMASASVGGLTAESVDPTGITDFEWDFGDGSAVVNTANTNVQHTFATAGTFTVTLEVTNSAAGTDTYSTTYRVLGDPPPPSGDSHYLARTGNDTTGAGTFASPWLTLQKGIDNAAAGETIYLGMGTYPELIEMEAAQDGTVTDRITVDGQGVAQISARLSIKQSYWTFKNLLFKGYSQAQTPAEVIKIENLAHNGELLNNIIDMNHTLNHSAVSMSLDGGGPFHVDWPANWLISGNTILNGKGQAMIIVSGYNNTISDNTSRDHTACDHYRLFGDGNIIRGNKDFYNREATPEDPVGYHPDWVQTFGNNGWGSRNHILEGNLVHDCDGQIGQMVEGTAAFPGLIGTGAIGNWLWINNVFLKMKLGTSNTIPNQKVYNNLFWLVASGGGNAFGAGEGDRGSADGLDIRNNVFFECGADPTSNIRGWYTFNPLVTGTYDYNYVGGLGGAPKRVDDPPVASTYRWWEPNGINGGLPGFVDLAGLNFQLTQSSILRDRGVDLSLTFTTDYSGATRVAWDIGPLEYGSTYAPPDDPPPPPVNPPSAPTDLIITPISSNQILLNWIDVSQIEQGYHIFQSLTTGTGFELIHVTSSSVESHIASGLTPGTTYYYYVTGFNSEGESSPTAEGSGVTFLPAPQRFLNHRGSAGGSLLLGF